MSNLDIDRKPFRKRSERLNKLRKIRKECGFTLEDVGKHIGVATATIDRYELGTRELKVPVAKKLAKLYGCKWSDLYEDDDRTA